MKLYRLIRTDLRRALCSAGFLLSVPGVPLLMGIALSGMLKEENGSVWYYFCLAMGGDGISRMVLLILPVFAFGLSFAAEWEQAAVRYWLIRTGTGCYTCSRVLVSAFTGFLTIFLGLLLFAAAGLYRYPAFDGKDTTSIIYQTLMMNGQYRKGFLLYIIHHSLSGAVVSVCALWFSTLIPNRYAAAAAPMILYFTLLRLTGRMDMLHFLHPLYWVNAVYSGETVLETILLKLAISAALCTVMGCFVKINIDRRMFCE